jgi:Rad3-related DNA helicase
MAEEVRYPIEEFFPMPSYRPKQRETLLKCYELFERGKRLILLQAPVGFGKSAVNTALCRYYAPSIYSTPQLSLIDQIKNDPFLGKYFVEIKGRDHYACAKDHFLIPVKYGLCKRKGKVIPNECIPALMCPYYSQKIKAIEAPVALMSTAYFIVDAFLQPPCFRDRNLVVIDEGHFLAEYLAEQVKLEVSPRSLPKSVWEEHRENPKDVESIARSVEAYLDQVELSLEGDAVLTEGEVMERVKAEEWIVKAKNYLDSEIVTEWVWTELPGGGFLARPLKVRWMTEKMVWSRAERFIVSSATILDPKLWIYENGADLVFDESEMAFIDVGMIFPAENRKVIDMSAGGMRHDEQEENLPRVAKMLELILMTRKGQNVAVHVPSYELARKLYSFIEPDGYRIYLPGPKNRDAVLEMWKKHGGVLFAVAFHEGQDWKYDTCRVQVLAKTLYPDTTDPVVRKRLERGDFKWLMWTTLIRCLQAYGRAIRAEDDYMEFYVLDERFWDLIRNMWKYVPSWFREVVPKNRQPYATSLVNRL